MLQLVDEAEAIVTSPSRSLDEFGKLLHESWQIKRSLTQKITNANIDEIYEAGLSAGALGRQAARRRRRRLHAVLRTAGAAAGACGSD